MKICPERPFDPPSIASVHRAAFGGEGEARLVGALRSSQPDVVSLVAIEENDVVGHVLFSRIFVGSTPAMALAPVGVLPEKQSRGAGSALIRAGLEACRARGERLVVVLGHESYYPRFGFVPAVPLGILPPVAGWASPSFMVLELEPGVLGAVRGTVEYPPDFFGT